MVSTLSMMRYFAWQTELAATLHLDQLSASSQRMMKPRFPAGVVIDTIPVAQPERQADKQKSQIVGSFILVIPH